MQVKLGSSRAVMFPGTLPNILKELSESSSGIQILLQRSLKYIVSAVELCTIIIACVYQSVFENERLIINKYHVSYLHILCLLRCNEFLFFIGVKKLLSNN